MNDRNCAIDFLRVIACWSIVIYHSLGLINYLGIDQNLKFLYSDFLQSIMRSGVETFFLISGYLTLNTINTSTFNPKTFLKRRFLRIIPSYYAISSIYFIALSSSNTSDSNKLGIQWMLSLLFLSSYVGLSPIIFQGWFLEIEMLFYSIVFILMKNKFFSNPKLFLMLCCVILSIFQVTQSFISLGVGLLIGHCKQKKCGTKGILFVFLMILPVAFINLMSSNYLWLLGLVFQIVMFIVILNFKDSFFVNSVARVHKYTYSIFLTHAVWMSVFYKLFSNLNISNDAYITLCIVFSIYLSTFLVGKFFYVIVESRLNKLFKVI